ncbi:hypothetical protein E1A91_A12G092800v1 [Gossypium mustelinum]|nr:hypothetical protein E1A91_A12G092800v1 [Gossypium mustelinum]
MPDYSLDFSKIREMRKQNKREVSRASLGNEEEFINPTATTVTTTRLQMITTITRPLITLQPRREVSLTISTAASKPEPDVMIITNVSDEHSLLPFSIFVFDPMYLVCDTSHKSPNS